MWHNGYVRSYHGGYGFISSEEFPGARFFAYNTDIEDHWSEPVHHRFLMPGETVRFKREDTPKGPRATNIQVISLRELVSAQVVDRPSPSDFYVEFAWLGEVHRRNIVLKHIIGGLDERNPENLAPGDWIIGSAYTDQNGGIRIGHGVVALRPPIEMYEENRRRKPRVELAESKVIAIDGFEVVAGPCKHPNKIITTLDRIAVENNTNTRLLRMHRVKHIWYASSLAHPMST